MAKPKGGSSTTKAALEAENKRLAKENAQLKSNLNSGSKSGHFWRAFTSVVLVSVAGAVLVAGNLLFWAGNTIIDQDRFVATVTPLIQNQDIQHAIAQRNTDRLFNNVDVQGYIQEALPPRADFLAPTLADQAKQATESTLQKLLASQRFQDLWIEVMTNSHQKIINYVKNYQGDGTIDLQDIYNNLSQRLADTKLSFLVGKQLPDNVGNITLIQASWLPTAHNIVTNIGLYQTLATILFLGFSILAIWLAKNRRRMAITVGSIYGALMLLMLIAVRVANSVIASSADQQYQAAARAAADIITNPLVIATRTLLLIAVLTVIIAWITGTYRVAKLTRGKIQLLLEGKAHKALFSKENVFTKWVGRHKLTLQRLSVAIVAVIMLFVTLTPTLVVVYGLSILAAVLLIELLAAKN